MIAILIEMPEELNKQIYFCFHSRNLVAYFSPPQEIPLMYVIFTRKLNYPILYLNKIITPSSLALP
jgi:hypothetical protein